MKKFTRTIEDFECEKCGYKVKGNGYTNHCPRCLWSKHVDINPGDRLAVLCGGLMEPVGIIAKGGRYMIFHQCVKCGKRMPNKASVIDNADTIAMLSAIPLEQ